MGGLPGKQRLTVVVACRSLRVCSVFRPVRQVVPEGRRSRRFASHARRVRGQNRDGCVHDRVRGRPWRSDRAEWRDRRYNRAANGGGDIRLGLVFHARWV